MTRPRTKARFEADYLERTYGTIIRNPEIALTELVANASDAGASIVSITIPSAVGGELIVNDDGCGMTATEFRDRWMTLGYNRAARQGQDAEFPPGRDTTRRHAFGRNGIGRHGLFCFGNEYEVDTRKDGRRFVTTVQKAPQGGADPFLLTNEAEQDGKDHGTRLVVRVQRNLPPVAKISETLGCRFVADPNFRILVNGEAVRPTDTDGLVDERTETLAGGIMLQLRTFDAGSTGRTARQSGIAFWVGGRLVGDVSWTVGGRTVLDGRYKQAKRLVIVAETNELFDEVEADWSGFRAGEKVDAVVAAVIRYAEYIIRQHLKDHVDEATENVLREKADRLRDLDRSERGEVVEFIHQVTASAPAVPQEVLDTAVTAFLGLLETKSGRLLLQKLSTFSPEDVKALNQVLDQWSIQDCHAVLDEISRRVRVVEALEKLSGDDRADELHVLHPLITESRWLFGTEFESSEFSSNVSIRRAVEELFRRRFPSESFINPKKRPDLLAMPDRTISATATERMDAGLSRLDRLLLIELKKGRFEIGRGEMDQAVGYIEDLHGTGLIDGAPFVHAFVVGHRVSDKTSHERGIGPSGNEIGRVRACTYGQLVRTANARLFKLRERIEERYQGLSGQSLIDRILATTGTQQHLLGEESLPGKQ